MGAVLGLGVWPHQNILRLLMPSRNVFCDLVVAKFQQEYRNVQAITKAVLRRQSVLCPGIGWVQWLMYRKLIVPTGSKIGDNQHMICHLGINKTQHVTDCGLVFLGETCWSSQYMRLARLMSTWFCHWLSISYRKLEMSIVLDFESSFNHLIKLLLHIVSLLFMCTPSWVYLEVWDGASAVEGEAAPLVAKVS